MPGLRSAIRDIVTAVLAATGLVAACAAASSADIKVFSSGAPSEVAKALAPAFSQATGDTVTLTVGPLAEIQAKILAGARPDVVILPAPAIEALVASGKLRADSRLDLARVAIGVAIRSGAPVPDISSVDAVRNMLLAAKSVAHPDPQGGGFTGAHIARMIERMGIADVVKPKVRLGFAISGGVASIAKGDVEVGLFNISEIVPIEGVTLVGPLPPELQSYITFAGAIAADSEVPDAAKAILQSLQDPRSQQAWGKGGMEALASGR
jgi:molybdate transport system substrate-binding protein